MSSSQAIALCHCSTCAECWCDDVLQDTLSVWSLTCGYRAELKARLKSEVTHLTGLPRKGFMEVGYFRMMDMAGWFCRRRGRGHEVMKPSCKHLSLLLPVWVLSTSHTAICAQKIQVISVPAPSVECCQRLKKRLFMHSDRKLCCPSQDLRSFSSRGFLFEFGQDLFISSVFGHSQS